jgi:hemerythrin
MYSKTLWDPKFKVGSGIIDNQHKVMFDLIKDLNRAIGTGTNMRVLDTLLGVLLNYAFQHFEVEEEYFKNHPDFTRHCLEHYELIKKLNSFIVDFRNNRHGGDRTPSAFLEEWLTGHIEEFDRPFFNHDAVSLQLMKESDQVDEFESESKDRRLHKRIHHHDVIDGDISVSCYNASRLRNGEATIVNMSLGGLMLNSADHHEIDNLLVISCSIGANFKMKEKVQVKRVKDNQYGVEFVSPSPETIDFFTKLYGAVHLRQARLS